MWQHHFSQAEQATGKMLVLEYCPSKIAKMMIKTYQDIVHEHCIMSDDDLFAVSD